MNRKSRDVSGVYVRERYCVGGLAVAGIMDSRGTDRALRLVEAALVACVFIAGGRGELDDAAESWLLTGPARSRIVDDRLD